MIDYYKKPYSIEEVNRMITAGEVIIGDEGGLAMGPSHEDGGIKFLIKENGLYLVEGELEGYEYIFNMGAAGDCGSFFGTLNNHEEHRTPGFLPYEPSADILILDCRKVVKPKYLI